MSYLGPSAPGEGKGTRQVSASEPEGEPEVKEDVIEKEEKKG